MMASHMQLFVPPLSVVVAMIAPEVAPAGNFFIVTVAATADVVSEVE